MRTSSATTSTPATTTPSATSVRAVVPGPSHVAPVAARSTPPVAGVANATVPPAGPTLGPGCPDTADFYSYDNPDGDGWHPGATGGCTSEFLYTALNVNPKDPDQWQEDAGWTFRDLSPAGCTLNVWIPASPDANATAHYWVSTGSQNYSSHIATFTIDQAANQGRWYAVPITVSEPTLYVEIDDNGGTGPGQFIAAGAVNLRC